MFKGSALRRRWLAAKAGGTPLASFYDVPWPNRRTPIQDIEFVALDLETTGFSADEHEIVSIGWAVIRKMKMIYGERDHWLVRPEKTVTKESAVIHMLTDDLLAKAPSLTVALKGLLPLLAGRVLIAHHVQIEQSFLDMACRRCFGVPFDMPMVDTLALERRSLMRRSEPIKPGMLRLDAVRARYNLPRYKSHNAMLDAIAAGELFLAQAAHRSGKSGTLLLGDVCV